MLGSLVNQSHWDACAGCTARLDCPIKFNAESFRDSGIVEQVERIFLIQHWRRTRRATIRDVRSALSYFITGNLACEDVHEIRRSGKPIFDFQLFNENSGAGNVDLLAASERGLVIDLHKQPLE
jgi:hypothetical protein